MTRHSTYIVTAIVVAAVVAGVVVYANWDNLLTAIGLSGTYETGWIELTGGTSASGQTYPVQQSGQPGDLPLPTSPPPFAGQMSRWDCTGCTGDPGPITLTLTNAPAMQASLTMMLNYESSPENVPQAEPLKIESLDAGGAVADTVTVRDEISGACKEDNSGWKQVDTDCSSGGGSPLRISVPKDGKLRFSATGGSLAIGGIKITGQSGLQGPNVDIPKTADKPQIRPTEDMKFTFTVKNLTARPATKVILYETFMDNNLDGQIDMATSTIGSPNGSVVTFSSLGTCSGTPEAGGYCFMDLGGAAGVPDTIVAYLPTLEANAVVPINVIFKPKTTFEAKTYTNYTGITSQEMNAGNPTYPNAILEEIAHTNPQPWTWKAGSAPVTVTGGVVPPGALLLDKTPATQTVQQGADAIFNVKMGNSSAVPQNQVFFWDTWADDPNSPNSNNNFDQQVDSIWIKVAGSANPDYVQLTGAQPNYTNCGGTEALAACYIDIDADGAGDTILMYTNQALGQFPLTTIFDLKFKFKNTAAIKTYTNHVGVTSKEMNPQDPDYPGSFGVSQWNWILKDAAVTVSPGITPTPTPTPTPTQVNQPHATLRKSVAKVSVTPADPTIRPGDEVEYTLQLTNDGNQDLHNMKVIDNFALAYLENVTITQGTACSSSGPAPTDQVCFQIGNLPHGTSVMPSLKYTAKVKSAVPNNSEVNNNANCTSDEFPRSGDLSETCHASVMFKVGQGISPTEKYELWVTKDVDKATAKIGEKLTYTTEAGNKGTGAATNVWLIDSLLFTENGEVASAKLEQAFGSLTPSATVEDARMTLERQLQIKEAGTVDVYKNMPGDDATTGLEIPLSQPGAWIWDLDRDGIKDTIVHLKQETWNGSSGGLTTTHTQKPYTSVRRDLTAGDYQIINTALVIKVKQPGPSELYHDPAETTVKIPGSVVAAPVIGVAKTVTDTDETNKTANTAAAGEAMSYTVTYTNNAGAGAARGAFIEDDYDERYIQITDNGGASDSGSALLWTLGEVAAGQTITKTFKVTVNSGLAENGATFKNIGTVGAQGQANKSAETTTTVPPKTNPSDQPYLVTSKTVVNENGGTVEPGNILRYTVMIENKGKAAATAVSAEDSLPSSLEDLKVVTIPTGAKDESSGNKIKITGFTVNAGASVQIVYTAKVKAGTANGTKIPNDVTVTYGGGTTGGRSTGTSTGRVGSAFTGPGTGAAEANALEAGAAKAATTGANPLTTALVVIGLAIAAGIVAVILRRRTLAG